MSRLVIESDTRGWFEPDELLTQGEADIIRREFARHPWPPAEAGMSGFSVWGQPVVVEDRRTKPPRDVARVDIDRSPLTFRIQCASCAKSFASDDFAGHDCR